MADEPIEASNEAARVTRVLEKFGGPKCRDGNRITINFVAKFAIDIEQLCNSQDPKDIIQKRLEKLSSDFASSIAGVQLLVAQA